MLRGDENLFNYMNLNFFCNRLAIGLLDFKRTGFKPSYVDSFSTILLQLFDKYHNWSPVPKYNSIVDTLLDTEEENQLLTEVLKDVSDKKMSQPHELEGVINKIKQSIDEVKVADKITPPTKLSIDYLTNFLLTLSNFTLASQDIDMSIPSNRHEKVFVSLK